MTDPTADATKLLPSPTFWVVERFENERSAGYWSGGNSRAFLTDIEKAVHFCRREDAMWTIIGWHWGDVKITEHSYAENTRPQSAPPYEPDGSDAPIRDTAPPAGEPDFDAIARRFLEPNYPDIAARSTVALLVRFSHYLKDYCGLAARPKVEDAEVAKHVASLRDMAKWFRSDALFQEADDCDEAADLLERLAGELAEVTVDRDEWKQQHENLVGVRQTDIANLASKIDGLKVELDRRKGDPRTRLHNLCEALQEDLDKSPYTREEWEQVDREIVELQHKLRAAEAKLSEREAELAKVDGFLILGWSIDDALDEHPYDDIGDIARDVQKRHAARQQQKASAEPEEREK